MENKKTKEFLIYGCKHLFIYCHEIVNLVNDISIGGGGGSSNCKKCSNWKNK